MVWDVGEVATSCNFLSYLKKNYFSSLSFSTPPCTDLHSIHPEKSFGGKFVPLGQFVIEEILKVHD